MGPYWAGKHPLAIDDVGQEVGDRPRGSVPVVAVVAQSPAVAQLLEDARGFFPLPTAPSSCPMLLQLGNPRLGITVGYEATCRTLWPHSLETDTAIGP